MTGSKLVYLGLGSNLGDRAGHLQQALARMADARLAVRRESCRYESAPMYRTTQPTFLNMVAELETDLFPRQLLTRLQHVERELGRRRVVENGPRTIDLDILLYGHAVMRIPALVLPHPRLQERRFVLEPLAELAPDLRHPVLRKTMRELLAAVRDQDVRVWHGQRVMSAASSPGPLLH